MIPSSDVLVAHLAGEAVLLNLADKSYYRLNETAALIWSSIESGASREEILAALLKRYEVDEASAREQLDGVISDLVRRNLLTPVESNTQ